MKWTRPPEVFQSGVISNARRRHTQPLWTLQLVYSSKQFQKQSVYGSVLLGTHFNSLSLWRDLGEAYVADEDDES